MAKESTRTKRAVCVCACSVCACVCVREEVCPTALLLTHCLFRLKVSLISLLALPVLEMAWGLGLSGEGLPQWGGMSHH